MFMVLKPGLLLLPMISLIMALLCGSGFEFTAEDLFVWSDVGLVWFEAVVSSTLKTRI